MECAVKEILDAAAGSQPFFVSTPNLNFLVGLNHSLEFRDSILGSDLCLADGIAVSFVARLLGIPLLIRVPGSDLFDALIKSGVRPPLRVFFFGGANTAAAEAQAKTANRREGIVGIGHLNPGWGSIEEMSSEEIIDEINGAESQFLVVALGAQKGQIWLWRNQRRLSAPVRAHLGATMNFLAGGVRRAPPFFRKSGLEWVWRIWEEPALWRRYWNDGFSLIRLLVFHVLPLAFIQIPLRSRKEEGFQVTTRQEADGVTLRLCGSASQHTVGAAIDVFRQAIAVKRDIEIDLSSVSYMDARFLGLLLMLRKKILSHGQNLKLSKSSRKIRRIFVLQRLEFLLAE